MIKGYNSNVKQSLHQERNKAMLVKEFLDVSYIHPMWKMEIKQWNSDSGCYDSMVYRSLNDYTDDFDGYEIDSIDIRSGSIEIVV